MLNRQQENAGQAVLALVLLIIALLIIFVARGIEVIEIEQSKVESERMRLMAENAYQNITQMAIWMLEADAREEKDRKERNPDAKIIDSLFDKWAKETQLYYDGKRLKKNDDYFDKEEYEDSNNGPVFKVNWRIVDAHSYFPINSLVSNGAVNEENRKRYQYLLESLKITDADKLTESLADWIDGPLPTTPTTSSTTSTTTPTSTIDPADTNRFEEGAKNGLLLNLAELQMVPGYTQDILWGNEEEGRIGLYKCITTAPITKINANTAPPWVIVGMHEKLDRSKANSIANGRSNSPYETMENLGRAAGTSQDMDVNSIFTLHSDYFFIEMKAKYGSYEEKKRVLLQRTDSTVSVVRVENHGIFRWDEETTEKMDEVEQKLIESLQE